MTPSRDARKEAETLALRALTYIVAHDTLRSRLLDMTGLDSATLRSKVGDPALLAAALAFLEAHEPDLVACAAALDSTPKDLTDARSLIEARVG